jgi:SagB-type dehydrogenase family enzyme
MLYPTLTPDGPSQELYEEPSPAELYHSNSNLSALDLPLFRWIHTVNSEAGIRQIVSRPEPGYPGAEELSLPEITVLDNPVFEVMARRRSRRAFAGGQLPVDQLSLVVRVSAGVTGRESEHEETSRTLRAYPSGGALYPCELFCLVWNIGGIPPGVYYYSAERHSLQKVGESISTQEFLEATYLPPEMVAANGCFVIGTTFIRNQFKYGERGYRFTLLEAGHLAQNLLLACESEGLAAVPVGGFIDSYVNRWIRFNGVEQAALYLVPFGFASEE